MEETTTDAGVQEQAQATAQPEEQQAEAVITPDSEPNQSTEKTPDEPAEADNSEESDDFDYEAWLEKKGIDPATPEGKAAIAKSWREVEKKMHATTQKSSELEKQLTTQPFEKVSTDPLVQEAIERTSKLELTMQVNDWKRENSITPEKDIALGEYLSQNTDKAFLLKNGYLTLDDVAAMSGVNKEDRTALKSEGKKEALEQLANKQRATAPKGGATNPAADTKSDPIMEALLEDN